MHHTKNDRHDASRHQSRDSRARVRALMEAGASGHALSGREVREVCEALRAQFERTPTHFHSGFGA